MRVPVKVPVKVLAIVGLCLAGPATAAPRPVVLELFTSQSCSSCPPADALMAEYARNRHDVLPLDFHVDYWNQLSWRDPYSSREATDRQRDYAASLGSEVFTPQLVIDGSAQVVGSDREAVEAAIAAARARQTPGPLLTAQRNGSRLEISVGPGASGGKLLLIGFDAAHTTRVEAGENGGRTLSEANIVRSWRSVGIWTGAAARFEATPGEGERAVLLLQDLEGRILATAEVP